MNKMSDMFMDLNSQQQNAVFHNGVLRLIAGPGSGKTRVIISKIVYLIVRHNIRASQILALAFTNKAAEEMRDRINQILPEESVFLKITTFHSLCYRILKEDGFHIGVQEDFMVLDDSAQKQLLKAILKEIGFNERQISNYEASELISHLKNNLDFYKNPGEFIEKNPSFFRKLFDGEGEHSIRKLSDKYEEAVQLLFQIFQRYEEIKNERNRQDFDDLIVLAGILLEQVEEVRDKWREKFRFILVDEFQDVSYLQYFVIKILCQGKDNLTVVGDEDQTIYSWRGADPNIMVHQLQKDFPGVRTVKLEQNYRSTPEIVFRANALIKNNKVRVNKHLFTNKTQSLRSEITFHFNPMFEAKSVVDAIKLLISKGNKPSSICIIYRSNHYSRFVENFLLKEKIPYKVINKAAFYDRRIVKDYVEILKVLLIDDDSALFTVLEIIFKGIGPKTQQKFANIGKQHKTSFLKQLLNNFDTLKGELSKIKINPSIIQSLNNFSQITNKFRDKLENSKISVVLREFLNELNYFALFKTEEQKTTAEELFITLKMVIQQWEKDGFVTQKQEFLDYFSLYASLQGSGSATDYVTCITAHGAKGMEFDFVFVVGLNESLFPVVYNKTVEEIEEERRLAYVAITRAKQKLFVSYIRRTLPPNERNVEPSRFLSEMGFVVQKTGYSLSRLLKSLYKESK